MLNVISSLYDAFFAKISVKDEMTTTTTGVRARIVIWLTGRQKAKRVVEVEVPFFSFRWGMKKKKFTVGRHKKE